jgi:hypothetical protein
MRMGINGHKPSVATDGGSGSAHRDPGYEILLRKNPFFKKSARPGKPRAFAAGI